MFISQKKFWVFSVAFLVCICTLIKLSSPFPDNNEEASEGFKKKLIHSEIAGP